MILRYESVSKDKQCERPVVSWARLPYPKRGADFSPDDPLKRRWPWDSAVVPSGFVYLSEQQSIKSRHRSSTA